MHESTRMLFLNIWIQSDVYGTSSYLLLAFSLDPSHFKEDVGTLQL